MSRFANSSRRISLDDIRVELSERPGWVSGSEKLPAVGDQVLCSEGDAEVVRVRGKTGDGSRLLELTLEDRPSQPFFAAASNILVRPAEKKRRRANGSKASRGTGGKANGSTRKPARRAKAKGR